LPGAQCPLGLGDHCVDRRSDALVVKGREHDPSRPAVVLAVDRQQSIAEQRRQLAEIALPPVEVRCMGDEHVVVGGRTEHEHEPLVEDAQAEDRAEALVAVEQDWQRAGNELSGAREVE